MPLKKKIVHKKKKLIVKCSKITKTYGKSKKTAVSQSKAIKIHKSHIKRVCSPFNKLLIKNEKYKSISSIRASPFSSGLSRNEKIYIIYKCQSKLTRFEELKKTAIRAFNQNKIFSIFGSCNAVRNALIERGWVEKILPNHMNMSKIRNGSFNDKSKVKSELERLLLSNLVEKFHPNFIWRTKEDRFVTKTDIRKNYNTLVNRLDTQPLWTTKLGLCCIIKTYRWHTIEDIAEVKSPRAYIFDSTEIPDFEKDYKITACTSLLKWILIMITEDKPIFVDTGTVAINVIIFAINRCKEYIFRKQNKDIDYAIRKTSDKQWDSFLKKYYSIISKKAVFKTENNTKLRLYLSYAEFLLNELHKYRPQLKCEGYLNIWIIKPAYYSRGRGIMMASQLHAIKDALNKGDAKYVIQKYIEEPLLIYETKFDIRQYYLITSTYPLIIWMYKDCYLKFSSQKYQLNNYHESIHLTNNAVQKKYANCIGRHEELPANNMWDLEKYKSYLIKNGKDSVWENIIYPGMKKSIINLMLSCQESMGASKNRFELYGCDFILDRAYKPWIIEINACPDLAHTTQVTAQICPAVVHDLIKVVIDYPKNPKSSTGNFECIYKQPMTMPKYVSGKELSVQGYSLPKEYFYTGDIIIKELYENVNVGNQWDIRSILEQLKQSHYNKTQNIQEHDCRFTKQNKNNDYVDRTLSEFEMSLKSDELTDQLSSENIICSTTDNLKQSEATLLNNKKDTINCPQNISVTNIKSLMTKTLGRFASTESINKNAENVHSENSVSSINMAFNSQDLEIAEEVLNATKQIISFINGKEKEYINDVCKRPRI